MTGGGFSSGFSSGFQVSSSPIPPPSVGITAVVVGFSSNTNGSRTTAAPLVWLYDPTTGKNVVNVNGTLTEFTNLSQFPGTFGFTNG